MAVARHQVEGSRDTAKRSSGDERGQAQQGPAYPYVAAVPGLLQTKIERIPVVQRSPSGSPADPLGGTQVEPGLADRLARRRGSGTPLPATVAEPVGGLLGTDLSAVRVHRDPEADHISRSIHAQAFTYGTDVYFTGGTYSPDSSTGRQLLVHELAHVAQNRTGSAPAGGSTPTIGHAADPAEAAADATASRVLQTLRRQADHVGPAPDALASSPTAGLNALRRRENPITSAGGNAVIRRGFFDDLHATVSGWFGRSATTAATTETTVIATLPRVILLGKGGAEKVQIEKESDQAEAEQIISDLGLNYGIDLSSQATVDAIKMQYSRVMAEEFAKLQTAVWKMKELRALQAAVTHFAPILGPQRGASPLGTTAQGVTTIGRVQDAINRNAATGKVETGTMGEYFGASSNVGLFNTVTNLTDPRYVAEGKTKDNETTLQANSIHEMAHGLIQPTELANWIATLDFWVDRYTPSGKVDAEIPPTRYGATGGAAEDLCESVAIFFINRPMLKSVCPQREAFLAKMVDGWKPPQVTKVLQTAAASNGSPE